MGARWQYGSKVVWSCGPSWPCWGSCVTWVGDAPLGSPWDPFVLNLCPKLHPCSRSSVLLRSQSSKMLSDLSWWSWFPSQLNTAVIMWARNLQFLVVGSWLLQWAAQLVGGMDLRCLSVQSRESLRSDTQLWLLNGGRFLCGKVVPSAVCYWNTLGNCCWCSCKVLAVMHF